VSLQAEASAASTASRVRPEPATARASARTPHYEQFRQSSARRPMREEPEVLIGEIIDSPRTRTASSGRRAEPDIIDAEYTVIGNEVTAAVTRSRAPARIESGDMLPATRNVLPATTARNDALVRPLETRIAPNQLRPELTPEAKAKLIKDTYGRSDEPTTGRIVDTKA
jgi:hypothetical protein